MSSIAATGRTALLMRLLPLLALALHAALWRVSEPVELFSDFYKAYYPAAERLIDEGLTAAWPFSSDVGASGFVNLPIVAYVFVPFAALGLTFGEEVSGFAFLAVGIASVGAILALLPHVARVSPRSGIATVLFAAVLTSGPLVNSLREGNTTHFVLLALLVSVLALRQRRDALAGLLIGMCAVIKLPMLLLVAWILWTRRWTALLGWTIAVGGTVGLSIAVFGVQSHRDWVDVCVLPFMTGIVPAFNVQSVDGFLMRLETGDTLLRVWEPVARPHFVALARLAVIAALGLALLRAVLPDGRKPNDEIDLAILLVLALLTSPLSWTHYYLLLLLPAAVLAQDAGRATLPRPVRLLAGVGFLLAAMPVVDVAEMLPSAAAITSRTIVSAWFFGGLAIYVALLLVRFRMSAVGAPDAARSGLIGASP